jgi:NAD(P)-dependent dehydrogenase (short-subunit alcohol dehydrogenase family)
VGLEDRNRVVLITGATGVLGRAVARRFSTDGARVALVGRDTARLNEVGRELGTSGETWLPVTGELTDADAARAVVTTVEDAWGAVDVLIHVVGGYSGGTPVTALDPDEVRGLLDQHLWTTLWMCQAVVPGMQQRGAGRILAVSSPFASEPGSKAASYAIAKSAQELLIRSLAKEVADSGVTANVVVVKTIDETRERDVNPSSKTASWTTPEEIAETFLFLASPAAGVINGARIPLHGRG